MAYWGEAMSHNHPLWAQQDTEAAKAILEKIAPTLGRAPGEGEAAEGEGVPEGDRHPLLLAGRQAGARQRVLGCDGGDVCAVARRSRSGDVVRAVAARHRAADRQGLPPPGAGGIDCREGVRGEPEAPRRRALHHSRVRRSRSRAARPERRARLRRHRAVRGARAAYAVAHLRAARHVGGRPQVEHRRLQVGDRAQRADEAGRGTRGLPHARLARIRQPDARQHRRSEGERRVGEAGRRAQSGQRRHHATAISACARA